MQALEYLADCFGGVEGGTQPGEARFQPSGFETREEIMRSAPVGVLGGLRVLRSTSSAAVKRVVSTALAARDDRNQAVAFRFVNAYNFALANRNEAYFDTLAWDRSINFPDGKPLAFSLSLLEWAQFDQVRGPDTMPAVIRQGQASGLRHFLLGGTDETLAKLERVISQRFPDALVVGAIAPPFRSLSSEELARQDGVILDARPDIVWVGLGTPKQDFEAKRLTEQHGLVTACVGAAFDFMAGAKSEAPVVFRRVGLEWAFRLATEPRRLWRRYLFGNSRFVRLVIVEAVRRRVRRGV